MSKNIFWLFILLFLNQLSAQQNLDSLYAVWQDNKQTDSTRVNAYGDYIWDGFIYSKPDSALVLSEALHRFAKEQEYPYAASFGYHLQGVANYIQGNYTNALECYEKSLAILEILEDKRRIAGCLNNIGIVMDLQGQYIRALEYYEKSLEISQEIGDSNISDQLTNIGLIYNKQGNYTRALEYYEKSLEISEEVGDKDVSSTLYNIGNIYTEQDNYTSALEYYDKAMALDKEFDDKMGIAVCLISIGVIREEQDNYTSALEYHEKALAISEEMGDKNNLVISLNNMGGMYADLGKYTMALGYCTEGLAIAQESGYLSRQNEACECLYSTYKAIGKSQEALQYHEQMLALNDSLQAKETTKKLQQMEFAKQILADSLMQVEKDLQVEMTHQAEVRTKDRNRNLAIGAGVFFLVLSGGFYSRWRYVRKSKQIIEKEKDRSENLLLNILPSEIAEELKLKGSVDAQDFDQVSVLFTDFKGFTTRSEKLSAQALVREINHCFKAFDHICEKYKIEKIKTIGDAYMAGGGLPVPTDDAVKNTVLAALEMQAFMVDRIAEKKANNEVPFEMRVGIHTGPVVAGIVGVKKFQYDIWGDTVNTASRMESAGEVGKVNISEATYEIIRDDPQFAFKARGKIKAKGKGEINMFFVDESA